MRTLMEDFSKMPGIGARSAQRLAFYILRLDNTGVKSLINSIEGVKKRVKFCMDCNNLSELDKCSICSDETRDKSKICVVEGPSGIFAIEKTLIYKGMYHVLLGALSPLDGVGPDDIRIEELIKRVSKGNISEVIIATDFTTEGEATALYLFKVLKGFKIKVSRLARGVPAGAALEYADVGTIQEAFQGRREV